MGVRVALLVGLCLGSIPDGSLGFVVGGCKRFRQSNGRLAAVEDVDMERISDAAYVDSRMSDLVKLSRAGKEFSEAELKQWAALLEKTGALAVLMYLLYCRTSVHQLCAVLGVTTCV